MKRLIILFLSALLLVSCGDNHFSTWRGYNEKWYEDYRNNQLGKDPDVVRTQILASGIIIESYHDGYGAIPKATEDPVMGTSSEVYVRMSGYLADGSVFLMDGTTNYNVSDLVDGLGETFKLMPQGSHWKVIVPSDLGYGADGHLGDDINSLFTVPPYSVLIFDIELIDVTNY